MESNLGDYVVIHTGFALSRLDPEEAEATLALLREVGGVRRRPGHEVHRRVPRRRGRAEARRPARQGGAARTVATASWNSAAATRTRSGATASSRCSRLPVEMIHGPGCPVCVLPIGRLEQAMVLARRPERHALHVRRPDACPGPGPAESAHGEGRGVGHPHGVRQLGRAPFREGQPLARGRVLRDRLRDDHASHGGRREAGCRAWPPELQRVLQPRPHPVRHRRHPRLARGQGRTHPGRRLRRPRPRQHDHRHRPLRALREGTRASRSSCPGSSRST